MLPDSYSRGVISFDTLLIAILTEVVAPIDDRSSSKALVKAFKSLRIASRVTRECCRDPVVVVVSKEVRREVASIDQSSNPCRQRPPYLYILHLKHLKGLL